MREYRHVPALESGSKLSNPDLQSIGEKNYTDIILRYGNLTTRFPQLETKAKTIVAAINERSTVVANPSLPSGGILETEDGEPIQAENGQYLEIDGEGGDAPALTSIGIDGEVYKIEGGGGGGTTVVANPEGEATSDLYSLQVANTIYKTSVIIPNPSNVPTAYHTDLATARINQTTYNIQPVPTDVTYGAVNFLKSLRIGNGYHPLYREYTATLIAGNTTLVIRDSNIRAAATYNIYTSIYGVELKDMTVTEDGGTNPNGTITMTFEAQQQDIQVKVRMT